MALKEYDVEINGQKTTLQLSDEDAERQGLKSTKAKEPANKSATPANKAAAPKADK